MNRAVSTIIRITPEALKGIAALLEKYPVVEVDLPNCQVYFEASSWLVQKGSATLEAAKCWVRGKDGELLDVTPWGKGSTPPDVEVVKAVKEVVQLTEDGYSRRNLIVTGQRLGDSIVLIDVSNDFRQALEQGWMTYRRQV